MLGWVKGQEETTQCSGKGSGGNHQYAQVKGQEETTNMQYARPGKGSGGNHPYARVKGLEETTNMLG